MPSALGGFARGLGAGVELTDRLQGRQDELELKRAADARSEEDLKLRRSADERAGRQSAIAEEKGQLEVDAAKEEQKYKVGRQAHMAQYIYNQKNRNEDGTDVPAWKLAYDRGVAMADYDMANGKISAADQMKFAEYRKTTDDKEVQEAFGHLWARNPKKAKAFLDKFGATSAEFSSDGEVLTFMDKDGKKTDVPTNVIAAGIGSPLPEKKLALDKTRAEIDFIKGRTGVARSMAERNEMDKARAVTNSELNSMYGDKAKGVERRLARLDQDEAMDMRVEGLSDARRDQIRKSYADKREALQKESDDVHNEAGHVGAIVGNARDAGFKIDARTARGYLESAAKGDKHIVMTPSGRVGYKKDGKVIPLPEGVVPESVARRLFEEANKKPGSAGAGASVPPAAPAQAAASQAASPAPAPQPAPAPGAPPYERYVTQRRGSAIIDAPPRSGASSLQGRRFNSKEEALKALSELPAYR